MNISRWIMIICGVMLWSCTQPNATVRRLMQAEKTPPRQVFRALDSIPDASLLGDEDWHAYLYLKAKARYELKRTLPQDTTLVRLMEYFNAKGKPAQAGLLALCVGRAYQLTGDYTQALRYDLEADRLARQSGKLSLQLSVLYERGHLCSRIGDIENSINRFEEMVRMVEKHPEVQEELLLGNLFLDVGNALLHLERYKEASECFDKLTDKVLNTLDSTIASYALYKKAYTLDMLERPQEALTCAKRSLTYAAHRKERLRNYLLIADIYHQQGQTDSVSATLARAEKQLTPENRTGKAGYYWLLSGLHKDKGDYRQALESLLRYESIMDTTTVPRMHMRVDRYRMHYEQMQTEMRHLRDRNRGLLIFCICVVVILTLGATAYLLFRQAKKRLQRCIEAEDRLQQQNILLSERTETLQEMAASNLQFMRKLTEIQNCPSDRNLSFLQRLNDVFTDEQPNHSEEICNTVDLMYDGFRTRLATAYPDLTEQEIELCCLMRAGIETKAIATLTGLSIYSIQKRRTSIRKKLSMEPGADIIRFLEVNLYNA